MSASSAEDRKGSPCMRRGGERMRRGVKRAGVARRQREEGSMAQGISASERLKGAGEGPKSRLA